MVFLLDSRMFCVYYDVGKYIPGIYQKDIPSRTNITGILAAAIPVNYSAIE